MAQDKEQFAFISDKWKTLQATNCWFGSNVVLHGSSFGVSIVPLWLSYRPLEWIRSTFGDNSKVMRRYTLLTGISALANEARLLTLRTYVHEAMNIGGVRQSNKDNNRMLEII